MEPITDSMLFGCSTPELRIATFEIREAGFFGGGELEIQIDTNAKAAYEADYWKGILDAQGKNDGTYY